MPSAAPTGPIRAAVDAALADLSPRGFDAARAALARQLADQLDGGMGLATAGVSKELRATLDQIEEATSDDGDDEQPDPLAGLDAELERLTAR